MSCKKYLLTISIGAFLAASAWAMPASDRIWKVKQPDGTSIEIRKYGNEHFHYTGTPDGYPLRKDPQKGYRYIDENGKSTSKKPSRKAEVLRNLRKRHQQETTTAPLMAPAAQSGSSSATASQQLPSINTDILSGEKKALVILVQFSDTKFSREDPVAAFDSLLNQEDYHLYGNKGSVSDYFVQNSMGKFTPHFDVVGPVTLSSSYANYGSLSSYGTYGAQFALSEALDTLIEQGTIDFTQYDNDGDRYLDYVHMIYAGRGAHDSELDSAIWPHKWTFYQKQRVAGTSKRNYYYVYTYACSAELDGQLYSSTKKNPYLAGIGNFLHEFSHLMGLPDLYATDSSKEGTPASWTLMDFGAYSRTDYWSSFGSAPPYYSAFERMSLGWLTPTELNTNGKVTIPSISQNVALRTTNPDNNDEFFLLEYRSQEGFDEALPNHGLLIWHIDYDQDIWNSATINNDISHQYVDIVEADGDISVATLPGDVFPGAYSVTFFDQFTFWDNSSPDISLSDISEDLQQQYVSFNVAMNATDADWDLTQESSSSTESSSSVIESSTSEESSSGSNSSSSEESSSSEAANSSDSESSSSEETLIATVPAGNTTIHLQDENGNLTISGLPQGRNQVSLFTLNGNLIYRKTVSESSFKLNMNGIGEPAILLVSQGKRPLFTGRIR